MGYPGRNNSKISNRPSGGGSKLQGLAPSATNFFIASSSGSQYVTQVGGANRNDTNFCINQLGGIGRERSQFSPSANGVNCICNNIYLKNYLNNNIYEINKFIKQQLCSLLNGKYYKYKNYNNIDNIELCYVGTKETFINDITTNSIYTKNAINHMTNQFGISIENKIFSHLTSSTNILQIYLLKNEFETILVNINIPEYIRKKIILINNEFLVNYSQYSNPYFLNRYGQHTLGIIHNFRVKSSENDNLEYIIDILNRDNYGTGNLINELSIYGGADKLRNSRNIIFSPGGLIAFTSNSAIIHKLIELDILDKNSDYRFIGGSGGAWTIYYGLKSNSNNKLSIFSKTGVADIISQVYSNKKSSNGSITSDLLNIFTDMLSEYNQNVPWFFDYQFNWQNLVDDIININTFPSSYIPLNIKDGNKIYFTGTLSKTSNDPPYPGIQDIDIKLNRTDGLYSFWGWFNYYVKDLHFSFFRVPSYTYNLNNSYIYKNNLPIIFQYNSITNCKIQSNNIVNSSNLQNETVDMNEVMALSSAALGFLKADENISPDLLSFSAVVTAEKRKLVIKLLKGAVETAGYDLKNTMPTVKTSNNITFYGMDGGNSDYNGFWSLLNTENIPDDPIHITRATWCTEPNPEDYFNNLLLPSMLDKPNYDKFLTTGDGISPGFLQENPTYKILHSDNYDNHLKIYQITGKTSKKLNYNKNKAIIIDLIICSTHGLSVSELPITSDTTSYEQFYERISTGLNNYFSN